MIIPTTAFRNLLKSVTYSPYGKNAGRILGILLDLFPEPLDMNIQGLHLGLRITSPDRAEDICLLERHALVVDQELEKIELLCRDFSRRSYKASW